MISYEFTGKHVFDLIDNAPEHVREAFLRLLEPLRQHPHPLPGTSLLGVQPFKDPERANCYTAPFDDALVMYEIHEEKEVIWLRRIVWLDTSDEEE